MTRHVAFLRGMNLGGRRITNEALCDHVRALGFDDVSAFLGSGNVLFRATRRSPEQVAKHIQSGLARVLDYDVPTFVRTADEVRSIAAHRPFDVQVGEDGGRLQVALLTQKPTPAARKRALACATPADRLHIQGRELYWLPRGRITESKLDLRGIEKVLGTMTVRTLRTLERLSARLSDGSGERPAAQ